MNQASQPGPNPAWAATKLAELGFLAGLETLGGAQTHYLLVALRAKPTLAHYDPETIEYWISEADRGRRQTLTRETHLPLKAEFSWGLIRLEDRLQVTNEYLTFGGRLDAELIDGVVIAVFSSSAPILRRGGHSQGWDEGADSLGAFMARFLLAIDYQPGFESAASAAEPAVRYAAFLFDATSRYRASLRLREEYSEQWATLRAEERRLENENPGQWAAGVALWQAAGV